MCIYIYTTYYILCVAYCIVYILYSILYNSHNIEMTKINVCNRFSLDKRFHAYLFRHESNRLLGGRNCSPLAPLGLWELFCKKRRPSRATIFAFNCCNTSPTRRRILLNSNKQCKINLWREFCALFKTNVFSRGKLQKLKIVLWLLQ